MSRAREPYEFSPLAGYNSEVARGIVHTPEWRARMAVEQARFDALPHPSGVKRKREGLRGMAKDSVPMLAFVTASCLIAGFIIWAAGWLS